MRQTILQTFRTLIPITKEIAIILVLALAFSSCTKNNDFKNPLEIGSDAPSFTLKSLAGTDVSLSDFTNKVVVLFFFGDKCPSCKAVAPNVQSMLVSPFASNTDYMVLGLDQWNGKKSSVEAFKISTNVTFPLLLDASGVASDYNTTYDRIVIIDKSGKIAFTGKQSAASDIAAAKAKVMELTSPESSGNIAPGFTLTSLDGPEISLSNFTNKVVLLYFFGNNCPSCKASAPNVESMLVTPFASETNYAVLGLDQWNGNTASVDAFKTITNVTFPLLLNASGVAADYQTTYDRIIVVDKLGNIAFSGKQAAASDIAAAKAKVTELLAD